MVESQKSLTAPLIISIMGPLMNKVKLSMMHAKKNRQLAAKLTGSINVLAEQILPHYLSQNKNDYEMVSRIHDLSFLLAMKAQNVFTNRIISSCIDHNVCMQALSQILARIFRITGCGDYNEVINLINTKLRV